MMMLRMISGAIMIMGRGRSHAVLAERHRHGCIALQRQPQRDQHRQNRSPAVHRLSICHNILSFQSSEPESGTKVPYFSIVGSTRRWLRTRSPRARSGSQRSDAAVNNRGEILGTGGSKSGQNSAKWGTGGAVAISKTTSCACRESYEPRGRGFKSCRARHIIKSLPRGKLFFFIIVLCGSYARSISKGRCRTIIRDLLKTRPCISATGSNGMQSRGTSLIPVPTTGDE